MFHFFGWKQVVALACLAMVVNGCGGGSSANSVRQQAPPVITLSGTYAITVTLSATPAGSTKSISLSQISLALVVK
jgi:hypothetical protein